MTVVTPPFKVIIIGAGLAGSLLANGLIRQDIDVQVYERNDAHAKREGLQIRLTAPALAGMRTCLTPEHHASIIKKFGPASGLKAEAPRVFHKDWTLLVDLSRFSVYGKNAPINRGVLRDALANPIHDVGKLHYSKKFERYEIIANGRPEERVRVIFTDGTTDECDILIGADGSYSKVNEQIGLDSIRPIKKHIALAAKCELPTDRFLKMSKELCGGPVMTWADNMSYFFGVYLPKKYDADGERIETGRSLCYDESLSSCMVGLNVAKEKAPVDLADRSLDEQWDFFADSIQHWSPQHREVVELVRGAPLHIYVPRVASRPSRNWRKSAAKESDDPTKGHPRVWLMGDAIHAMLPPRGMGGNQAMYDAGIIMEKMMSLAKHAGSTRRISRQEIENSVADYEAEMIPRAFEWVKKSGGDDFVPVDSSTISGRLFFFAAAQILSVACLWQRIAQFFSTKPPVDETPEFNA